MQENKLLRMLSILCNLGLSQYVNFTQRQKDQKLQFSYLRLEDIIMQGEYTFLPKIRAS